MLSHLRATAALAVLACVLRAAVAVAATTEPHLEMRVTPSGLHVSGHTSSTAHESILRNTARRFFADRHGIVFDVRVAGPTPPGWALVTDMTLRALATTGSASATVTTSLVEVRGVTPTADDWQAAAKRIDDALLNGMRSSLEVFTATSTLSYAEACRMQLAATTTARRIDFSLNGSELGVSAKPLLDALVELAAECPQLTLAVTGHTDATGNEAQNVALSLARANAIVAELVRRGLRDDRLQAFGAGSSQPVAAGNDRRARKLNRRVEFDFVLR